MKHTFLVTILFTVTPGGCSTLSNQDLDESPNSFGKAIAGFVFGTVLEEMGQKRCTKRKTDKRTTTKQAASQCRQHSANKKSADELKTLKEDRERKEAFQQAYDNRSNTTDTADIIERQRRSNDWIADSEKHQRSVVVIDKPGEID